MQIETIKLNPCAKCGRVPVAEYVKGAELYATSCHGRAYWGETGNEAALKWNEANPVSAPAITLNPCTKCGKLPTMKPRINGVYYLCCKVEAFELNEITAINFWNLINTKLQK